MVTDAGMVPTSTRTLGQARPALRCLLLALAAFLSGCAHGTPSPKETCPERSDANDGSFGAVQRIHNSNGYIVDVFQAPQFTIIYRITDPYGRIAKVEYDSDLQPTVIHWFDWSQLEKAEDGKWYHYSYPGWWPKSTSYTIVRLSDGTVNITTSTEIVQFSTSGVRWNAR